MVPDWEPLESGCFRPYYYNNVTSIATENSLVTALNPLMLVVSEDAYDTNRPGYASGLYCKWNIRAANDEALSLTFVDVTIYPMSQLCDHDGLMVYESNRDQHGMVLL